MLFAMLTKEEILNLFANILCANDPVHPNFKK